MQLSNSKKYSVVLWVFILGLIVITALPQASLAASSPGVTDPKPSSPGTAQGSPSSPGVTGPAPSSPGVSGEAEGQTLVNPLKFKSLDDLLTGILKAAIELGTIILTLALVWTGFKFVAARGNEEKIREARTALMYTIIGGLILLGATAIKEVIQGTVSSVTP